jgi:hypothetical protein
MTAPAIIKVAKIIRGKFKNDADLRLAFHNLLRQSIDEVVDTPRTGRKTLAEIEKTEKTYIGTKVEILTRSLLGLTKGDKLDLKVGAQEVDVKFTVGKTWMIPMEAFGEICLLLNADEKNGTFGVGLLKMTPGNLTKCENRDKKLSVSARGRKNILWLARAGLMPAADFAAINARNTKNRR